MPLPTISGTGRLIADPELRFLPSGVAVCKLAIAFNSRKLNKDTQEWEDGDTFFGRGTVWRQEAENVAESLKKGDEVTITGKLKTESYTTKDGEKKSNVELIIDSIGATMKYATVRVQKMQRSSTDTSNFNDDAPF